MKAYVLTAAGGVENLILTDVEQPVTGAGEVLIETKAISINPVDVKVRASQPTLDMIVNTSDDPIILGWDISGVVVAVDDEVTDFEIGDRVFGMVNFPGHGKGYAEYVAAPADQLAKIPSSISFEDAAAATLAALTAHQVLTGRVFPGDHVLIHAGSGGVGHFAIQMARNLGASVTATSSAANRKFVLSLGANHHIDYRTENFEERLTDIDFVLDGMGGDILEKSIRVLTDGGKVVSLPSPQFSDDLLEIAHAKNVEPEFVLVTSNGDDMNELKEQLATGQLKPHVSKIFPFDELPDAHLHIEAGRTVGKIIIRV